MIEPENETPERATSGFMTTQLAELQPETLVDETALADCLGVSGRTVRRMIARGQLPAGIRLGGRRLWMIGKLIEYLEDQADRLAAEARKTANRMRLTN